MKVALFALLISLLITGVAHAQTAGSTSYSHSGKVTEMTNIQYRYPQFLNGQVFFKDGTEGRGVMNYQMLVKEIHFIDPKGDTLALADLPIVKQLTIGIDTFFFDKGIFRIIDTYGKVKFAVKETLRLADRQKIGAYGMKTSTSSIESYSSIRANQGTYGLSVAENVIFASEKTYHLRLKENQLLPLNWGSLAKAFPSKRNTMHDFASKNHIDLNNEEDVKKLLSFCSTE